MHCESMLMDTPLHVRGSSYIRTFIAFMTALFNHVHLRGCLSLRAGAQATERDADSTSMMTVMASCLSFMIGESSA